MIVYYYTFTGVENRETDTFLFLELGAFTFRKYSLNRNRVIWMLH